MKYLKALFFNASHQMQNLYIWIFLLLVLLFKFTVELFTSSSDPTHVQYLTGNLLPELTGMLIELAFILFVVEVVQDGERSRRKAQEKESERNKKIMLERRLQAQLRFLMRRIFENAELSNEFNISSFLYHAIEHEENQRAIEIFKNTVLEQSFNDTFHESVLNTCQSELPLILSLTAICSELSDRHVKAWMAIAYYLQQINANNDIIQNTQQLLSWIAMFDKHTFQQNLL